MASGVTKIADIIVPEIFTPYVQQLTEEKSRLVQSGVVTVDPFLSGLLAGAGLTFNVPSFRDLDNDADNVSTDNDASDSTPNKIGTSQEIGVRLSRNNSWSSMDLAAALAGPDPMNAIASRVGPYWTRRLQAVFLAKMVGIYADNDAAPTGTDTHVAGDMTNDVSGGAFTAGVTDFSAEAFLDAAVTMGDSQDDLGAIMVHSIVYNKMQKNNLIDFIPDARGEVNIPTFLGRFVIIDDGMPNPSAGIFHSYLMGAGAVRWGVSSPKVPTEVEREASAGDGGGQEILFNRVEWMMHATGHAYIGTAASGGPSNATTIQNLGHLDSWSRVWSERKQIKIARLITRES
jgi:hypothetical protein